MALSIPMRLTTLLLAAVVVAAAAGLTSGWRTDAVAVDGLSAEWAKLEPLERGLLVGAVNDAEFLYLVVAARDAESIPYLATGLIVWLDPAGRRAETFGVRLQGVERPPLPGMTPNAAAATAPTGISTTVLDRFDVLGPGKNQRRLVDLSPELGIELASSYSENEVAYELKIPLQKTSAHPYAVGAAAGRTIGLGIATPDSPANRSLQPRLVGDSGMIGGDPWYGGRGFAKYREDDGRRKPLEIWTTLTLAASK
jgi:hypothetical protein